jgi:transposase-like protein
MTKDTTKTAAVAADIMLFDNWFDAIEDGVRDRVRGFIGTILEEELDAALSRPRYGRRKANGNEDAAALVVGCRHGHRKRTLTGTFGKTEISVPRARIKSEDGKTSEWKSKSLRAYQRRTKAADALIAGACEFRFNPAGDSDLMPATIPSRSAPGALRSHRCSMRRTGCLRSGT